jgi:UDP-N-acetylmuramoylalanine--D-glutamate ligase
MIDLTKLGTQPIAVLGMGISGHATVAALRAAGIQCYAWDDKEESRTAAAELGAKVVELTDDILRQCRYLVASPGIPATYPAPHPVIARARELQLRVVSDIDLLWRAAPDATYIGITGTNGKSTTTALIAHILRQAGRNVAVGGNLGPAALSLPMLTSKDDIYVLELSSYQLELCPAARFDHAVFLNLTPDHMDRYASIESYGAAKCNILRARTDNRPQSAVIGLDTPQTARYFEEYNGLSARHFIPVSGQDRCLSGISAIGRILHDDIHNLRFDLTTARTLPGPHNGQNAAAAYAVCLQLGLNPQEIVFNILNFPGLAHRQQYITSIHNVEIVNDSKATNVDAASKAIACYGNVYWIAGGKPKSLDFTELRPFTDRIQGAYLIGEAADPLADWCRRSSIAHTKCGTLENAVALALRDAIADRRRPVTLLLSPACASYDQFKNFEDRGEQFIQFAMAEVDKIQRDAAC